MLHILDTNPLSMSANGWLEDTSKVQKYVMSDDAYSQREGTYRQYKQMRRKVGLRDALLEPHAPWHAGSSTHIPLCAKPLLYSLLFSGVHSGLHT